MTRLFAAASIALALSSTAVLAQTAAPEPVTVVMKGQDGADHGTVTLTQVPTGVLIQAKLKGLPAGGAHGYHFHQTGVCEGKFESAGGHYNPTEKEHGFMVDGGAHAGDMGNFSATDGAASFDVINTAVTLAGGPAPLNDADGTAIVIHAGPDDYASQPAGKSGDRIACGVVYAKP
ncbi:MULTISPECIES: superoxide dismutase family protein [unclassified Aureimonas]|uniref:superoxide dismutase family protein n=1 Tax=unclassified Aureimonas TaxID=2615206 RepID=UPI0006FFE2C1|nr:MULTISPECIES: superoxide dismutase family protein [unclassified Aureimonas]KQT69624.1 superoxide dismutase [Aureimonas sp. Leaf427]KQT80975.1 superoxide dismutase [Aureimonas sp. Leaf460]